MYTSNTPTIVAPPVGFIPLGVTTPRANVAPGVYTIHVEKSEDKNALEPRIGIKLKQPKFEMPPKVYGDKLGDRAALVSDHFTNGNKILGSIMVGQKGTGKTNLTEMICNLQLDLGVPVLLVDEEFSKWHVEQAIKLMGTCVVFFDEFEKVYSRGQMGGNSELLTLFSDKALGKVMFLITANNQRDLSKYIIHRPGRFLFKFDFAGIEEEIVQEICADFNVNAEITEFIIKHAAAVEESIDSIIAIARGAASYTTVEEFKELFKFLNVQKPSFVTYACTITGLSDTDENKERFTGTVDGGQFTITDNVTGMDYGKKMFYKRSGTFTKGMSLDKDWVMISVVPTEHALPVDVAPEMPIIINWSNPRPSAPAPVATVAKVKPVKVKPIKVTPVKVTDAAISAA